MAGTLRLEVAMTPDEAKAFEKTARKFELETETFVEIFMRRFIALGGFSFAMRKPQDSDNDAVQSFLFDDEWVDFLKRSISGGDWGNPCTADELGASSVPRRGTV